MTVCGRSAAAIGRAASPWGLSLPLPVLGAACTAITTLKSASCSQPGALCRRHAGSGHGLPLLSLRGGGMAGLHPICPQPPGSQGFLVDPKRLPGAGYLTLSCQASPRSTLACAVAFSACLSPSSPWLLAAWAAQNLQGLDFFLSFFTFLAFFPCSCSF